MRFVACFYADGIGPWKRYRPDYGNLSTPFDSMQECVDALKERLARWGAQYPTGVFIEGDIYSDPLLIIQQQEFQMPEGRFPEVKRMSPYDVFTEAAEFPTVVVV